MFALYRYSASFLGIGASIALFFTLMLFAAQAQEVASNEPSISNLLSGTFSGLEGGFGRKEEELGGQSYSNAPWKNSIMFDSNKLQQLYRELSTLSVPGQSPIPAQVGEAAMTVDQDGDLLDAQGNVIGKAGPDNKIYDLAGNIIGSIDANGSILDNNGNYIGIDTRVNRGQAAAEAATIVTPAFHLNSVLFYNEGSWTLWLNQRRIRKGKNINGLEILSVREDKVEFMWQPANLDLISPGWKAKLVPVSSIPSYIVPTLELPEKETAATPPPSNDFVGPMPLAPQASLQEAELDSLTQATSPAPNPATDKPSTPEPLGLEEVLALPTSLPEAMPENKATSDTSTPQAATQSSAVVLENAPLELPELDPYFSGGVTEKEVKIELGDIKKETGIPEEENNKIQSIIQALEAETRENELEQLDGKYKWEYADKAGNILVDPTNNIVKFRLGINQTFVSREMMITEGFVASTIIQTSPDAATGNVPPEQLESAVFGAAPQKR